MHNTIIQMKGKKIKSFDTCCSISKYEKLLIDGKTYYVDDVVINFDINCSDDERYKLDPMMIIEVTEDK